MSALESEYGITIEAKAYDGLTEMKEALRNQEIDAAGPVIRDLYLAEQDDFVLTDSIVDTTPVIIYKGDDYNDSVNVIATSDASLFNPEIVKVLFPDAEIYLCDDQKECLKAVADGKAGSMLIASSRINILNADPLMEKLSYAEMAKQTDIGLLSTKENRRAASIINKGIEQSSDVLSGVVLSQHSVAEENISILEFVSSHAWLIIGLAGVIILVLGVLLYRLSAGRKQLVAALADARDANAANVAKTTFLNNMSHDIRTPMNAIIGFTNIAMKRRPSPEIKSCLEKIQQSSDYLLTLMNDVLDVSRIESGKIEYNPVPVELDEVADTVINITNGFMENRDLKLRVKRTGMEKPCAMADELRLREVLLNIISNAVKFTDDGGSITVEMDYYPSGDGTHILVTYRIIDTGIGIGKEFIGKIFDEFAQEEGGARTKYKGTGLGMSITKRYVELMGGTIAVESKKNVGTTVTVKLPLELVQREEAEQPEETAEEQSLEGVRVLMAEDNDLNAEIAALLLEEQNMKVTRAVDGQDAVEQFRAAAPGTFDLILMDIMMPRMNGYEATQAIRSMEDRPDGKTIPIIAMTANAFAEDVQAAADAGMNAHLSKPVNPDVFYKALREHVHGQS